MDLPGSDSGSEGGCIDCDEHEHVKPDAKKQKCDPLKSFINQGQFCLDQTEDSGATLRKARALESYEKGVHKVNSVVIIWHHSGEETDEIATLLTTFLRRVGSLQYLNIKWNGPDPGNWVQEKIDMLLQAIESNLECPIQKATFRRCAPSPKVFQRFLAAKKESLTWLYISDGTPFSHGHIVLCSYIDKLDMKADWSQPDQLSIFLPLLLLSTEVEMIDVYFAPNSSDDELISDTVRLLHLPWQYDTLFRLRFTVTASMPVRALDISPVLIALAESPSIMNVDYLYFEGIVIKCPPQDRLERIHAVDNANLTLKRCTFWACKFHDVMFDDLGIVKNFGSSLDTLEFQQCQVIRSCGAAVFASNSICSLLTTPTTCFQKLELFVQQNDIVFLDDLGTALMQELTRVKTLKVSIPIVDDEETRTQVCAFLRKLGGNKSVKYLTITSSANQMKDVMLAKALRDAVKQNDIFESVCPTYQGSRSCGTYYDEIAFYVTMNKRGRQLIRSSNVQTGFWPIVLERQEEPSALFYILQRKVPDFFGSHG